jgi:hypothetical protein
VLLLVRTVPCRTCGGTGKAPAAPAPPGAPAAPAVPTAPAEAAASPAGGAGSPARTWFVGPEAAAGGDDDRGLVVTRMVFDAEGRLRSVTEEPAGGAPAVTCTYYGDDAGGADGPADGASDEPPGEGGGQPPPAP